MAPRNWRRPLTHIYNDNHKYGASLYSGAIDDIEKRYRSSIRSTHFRSDRPDLMSQTIYHTSSIGSAGPASADIFIDEDAASLKSSKRDDTEDYNIKKCQELRLELESLTGRFQENEAKVKAETTSLRRQMNSEMRELCVLIDQAQRENDECHKILKRHSGRMLDLQQYCEELEKRLQETHEQLVSSQKRCQLLERDVEHMKERSTEE
ncbi:uncharacterized protein LOC108864713 [Galendromus occidentalis]|uniref:Uncharacterized protein LOC108864713 n=1 Tax=Galendromus occidentalis TaxID=34638 RepID=A0AAJ7PAJ3_9ACAR|nr:uncharacterized protein LOC108864713 [Galendromus occidentalis]